MSAFSSSRVLVIAPHPDDDAIGCGGTLARLARRGARVDVTYITDGSRSHRSKRFPPAVLREVREGEARDALRHLGVVTEPQFLRAPDSGLTRLSPAQRERLIDAVSVRIADLRPEAVFLPWSRDPHADHVATASLVAEALARSSASPRIYWYAVWLSVRGATADLPSPSEASAVHVHLDRRELARKRAAILAHRSQTSAMIDDDPDGFRIDAAMMATWLAPIERFYRPIAT